jgi:hypothetical protein
VRRSAAKASQAPRPILHLPPLYPPPLTRRRPPAARRAGGQPLHDPEVFLLDFVPPAPRHAVAPVFAAGFANCVAAVAYLLAQGQAPRPRLVAQLAAVVPGLDRAATAAFFAGGGRAEHALDAVVAQCEADARDAAARGGGGAGNGAAAAAALPACARDGRWELVRQQLFSASEEWPMGPYTLGGEDVGDEWVHYDTSNWVPPPPAAAGADGVAKAPPPPPPAR